MWDLPGRQVEPDESERAALVREPRGEIGVDVPEADLDDVARVPLSDDGDRAGDDRLPGAAVATRTGNRCPDEHDDLGWFGVNELVAPRRGPRPV